MKNFNSIFTFLLFSVAIVGMSFTVVPMETISYKVNPADSKVEWVGHKVTGEHNGIVNLKEGNLEFSDGNLTGGTFAIDMTSIKCLDLQGEYAGKLEGHLKSPDFFGVETHPTATLEITKVAPRGTPGDYKVTGNLTIKGITNEIKFYTNVKEEDGKVTATSDIQIDRTEFDVRYGSGSFFDSLGDKTIYDEFDMTVALVATK